MLESHVFQVPAGPARRSVIARVRQQETSVTKITV